MIADALSRVEAIPQETTLKATTFQLMQQWAGQLEIDMMATPKTEKKKYTVSGYISQSRLYDPGHSSGPMEAVEIIIHISLPKMLLSLSTFKGKSMIFIPWQSKAPWFQEI